MSVIVMDKNINILKRFKSVFKKNSSKSSALSSSVEGKSFKLWGWTLLLLLSLAVGWLEAKDPVYQ